MKHPTKTANALAYIYDGAVTIEYSCVGETVCRHALCPLMPPTGDADCDCTYRDHGECIAPTAQLAAVEKLQLWLAKEAKRLREGLSDA